nr:MAG TPA: hypothetical protein [Microviridae sp.]
MKITPQQWLEVVKLISTFIIGLITALCIQSCTASMSVFWKNSNSKQESQQTMKQSVDSTRINIQPNVYVCFLEKQ